MLIADWIRAFSNIISYKGEDAAKAEKWLNKQLERAPNDIKDTIHTIFQTNENDGIKVYI